MNQINNNKSLYPPSEDFKAAFEKVLDEVFQDKALDFAWKNYFYYPEVFNSFDSVSQSITGASGIGYTATPQPIVIIWTGTTSGDGILVGKHLFQQNFLSFKKKQYFRTQFQVNSVSNISANITIGPNGYGFRILNNSLKGFVTSDGGTETVITLQTISANTTYQIEARFIPVLNKCIFFVDGIEKGTINGGLPTGQHTNLWSFRLETNENAEKDMYIQIFELIQKITAE